MIFLTCGFKEQTTTQLHNHQELNELIKDLSAHIGCVWLFWGAPRGGRVCQLVCACQPPPMGAQLCFSLRSSEAVSRSPSETGPWRTVPHSQPLAMVSIRPQTCGWPRTFSCGPIACHWLEGGLRWGPGDPGCHPEACPVSALWFTQPPWPRASESQDPAWLPRGQAGPRLIG